VAACEDPSGAKIYRSIDQGATFSYVALAITSNLRVRRNDYQMLYRSLKMRQIPRRFDAATAYYAIPFDLQFNPAPPAGQTPALVLATSTGGAISYDGGATWSTIDGDASSTQFWAVAWSNGRAFVATRGQGVIMAPLQAP
ncbi:MAG TPA: hypothetical protein VNG31_00385, partial [Candidatus Baltobacteraceae bacterium]|nr:hypothetical protein [Candidatus Baltobacteraceae bacterium]